MPNNPKTDVMNNRIALSLDFIIETIEVIPNIIIKPIDNNPKIGGMLILKPIAIQY